MRKLISITMLFAFLFAVAPIGCTVTPSKKAAKIRDQTIDQAHKIDVATQAAETHIQRADSAIAIASTQPGNPPQTQFCLRVAHGELKSAAVSLLPIAGSTAAITLHATDAAILTATVDAKLKTVSASYFSPRQKTQGWYALAVLVIFGLIAFAVHYFAETTGLGVVLTAIEKMAGIALSKLFGVIGSSLGVAIKSIYHVATLGLAYLGTRLGKAVASKSASGTAATVPTPAT